MLKTLKKIRKVIKETEKKIEKVNENSNGKAIDNDIIISYKAGAYEDILYLMKKFAESRK